MSKHWVEANNSVVKNNYVLDNMYMLYTIIYIYNFLFINYYIQVYTIGNIIRHNNYTYTFVQINLSYL